MSKLGTALTEIMDRHDITGSSLAEASGVPASTISRLRRGEMAPNPEDFKTLLTCITNDPAERAYLIRAHLLDECYGPGSELIQISVGDKLTPIREVAIDYGVKLPKQFQEALGIIADAMQGDQDLQDLVYYLAKIYSRKS